MDKPSASLRECPFCGGDAAVERVCEFYEAGCASIDCPVECRVTGKTEASAIERWNRRAPSTSLHAPGQQQELIERLMKAFQPEAMALVHQKILNRDDCSAIVSSFARIAAHAVQQPVDLAVATSSQGAEQQTASRLSDLEMTKLCAEAMGLPWKRHADCRIRFFSTSDDAIVILPDVECDTTAGAYHYNPLHDDAQAMALVKRCNLNVLAGMKVIDSGRKSEVYYGNGSAANADAKDLNRAIVECVAKMQAVAAKA